MHPIQTVVLATFTAIKNQPETSYTPINNQLVFVLHSAGFVSFVHNNHTETICKQRNLKKAKNTKEGRHRQTILNK